MSGTYTGTTHSSPTGGPKQHAPRARFARPTLRRRDGNMSPWFLKQPLSKPEYKRPRPRAAVA